MTAFEAVHREPVWRSRSDFIVATPIDPGLTGISTEQLWVRKIDERRFELCCIPFFAYDLALGDIVQVDADYLVDQVLEPSGRYVFRVHFGEDSTLLREEVVAQLDELGALHEWSSTTLLAVDARDIEHAKQVAGILIARRSPGQLLFETGRT